MIDRCLSFSETTLVRCEEIICVKVVLEVGVNHALEQDTELSGGSACAVTLWHVGDLPILRYWGDYRPPMVRGGRFNIPIPVVKFLFDGV